MAVLPVLIGTITSIIAYTLLFAGVYRLFTIAGDLSEIKELLREQKRQRDADALVSGPAPGAAESRYPHMSPH